MKPPAESQTAQPLLLGGIRPIKVEAGPIPAVALRLLSDERLAKLAAKGDRAAFGVVFDRYHRELYRYCLSLLRDPEDASDALQSAMVRALNALEGETRAIALRPWLYRIAHNEAMTLVRRRPPAGSADDEQHPGIDDVERSAESRAAVAQLLDDIRALPERQRGALVMRELGGLGYSEIAAALETSPAAAKQAIYEARRALFDLAKGRDMDCDVVRRQLSDGDGRTARGRALRSHLRGCTDCRDFQAVTAARRSTFASLAPGIPAAASAALRAAVAGGGSGGASGFGAVAGLGAPVAAKSIAALVTAIVVGAGASQVIDSRGSTPAAEPPSAAPSKARTAPPARGEHRSSGADRAGDRQRRTAPRRSTRPADGPRRSAGARQQGSASPGGTTGAPATQSQPQAAAPAPVPQQTAEPDGSPLAVAPVVEQAVPTVTNEVETVTTTVTDTVSTTVGQVQEELPVRTPQLLP